MSVIQNSHVVISIILMSCMSRRERWILQHGTPERGILRRGQLEHRILARPQRELLGRGQRWWIRGLQLDYS